MDRDHGEPADLNGTLVDLRAEDLCAVEACFKGKGCHEFRYWVS